MNAYVKIPNKMLTNQIKYINIHKYINIYKYKLNI